MILPHHDNRSQVTPLLKKSKCWGTTKSDRGKTKEKAHKQTRERHASEGKKQPH